MRTRYSLKSKITLATLLIFLASLWSLSIYLTYMLRQDIERQVGEQQLSTASTVAAQINYELDVRLNALKKVAQMSSQAMQSGPAAMQAFIEQRLDLQALFNSGVFATGTDGICTAYAPYAPEKIGIDLNDRDYIISTLVDEKTNIGRPVIGETLQLPVVVLATPVRDHQGKIIGALAAAINLSTDNSLEQITENRYGKTGGYMLISRKHRLIITSAERNRIMNEIQPIGKNPVMDRYINGHEDSAIYVNSRGVEVLSSAKNIPIANWFVVAVLPTTEAFAPLRELQQRMLYATLLLTLLAGSLTWWILNRQLKPMQTAAKVLAELSDSSQLLQPLPITTQDEISDLVGGFNRVLSILSQREQAVKDSELRWKFALEGAGDGIYDWNVQTNQAQYSKRWKEMLGYAEDDILPMHQEWVEHINPEDQKRVTEALTSYLCGELENYTIDYRLRCKDGSYKWILSRGIIVDRSDDGKPLRVIGTHTDITKQKEHEKQLEYMAHYDLLTGLPNRALFADRLHQAMAQVNRHGQLLAVAYLDLDGFKAVNDRYGHETGDQLLITLSNRMKQTMREGDTLARLGGDEFVAVLFDLANTGGPMLNRLLTAAALPVTIGDHVFKVSASLGVTFYPQADDVDADYLLRQADQAMYQAKLSGKNRYHIFDTEQDRNTRGRHESLEHIRTALAAREFVLYYQPKVNMRTGLVIGAEALIRWQHPERGLLPPGIFLPVIEDHPLAIKIGEWVIDAALTQMERWRAVGLDLPVSVNVGALQLLHVDFVDRLREILADHPTLSPENLEIEIIETSALEDLDRVSQIIQDCQAIGVNFALDDFGTGYSSLTYLKRLSVNQLKIDQSFVHDMLDDPDDLSILGGVLGLATAFRRQVIAEGVETIAHGSMLLQLGCELAQGYGIGRPMPADDLPAWALSWRPDSRWSNLPSVNRDKLPLLFATVEHRAWIQAVEDFIKGEREILPLMHHQCHFGTWLEGESMVNDAQNEFKKTVALHHELHHLAVDLCAQKAHGLGSEAHNRLCELQKLHHNFSESLEALMSFQGSV